MKYNVGDRVNYMVQERIEAHGSYKSEDNTSIQIERPDGFYEWVDKWRVIPPELPATQPADDKEYREFVEGVISGIESDLKQKQRDLKLCESGELIMDNELREEMYQDVEYMPRLIADIKKGVGL